MDDKELANAVVARGVGSKTKHAGGDEYIIMAAFLRSDQFVRDWRVAGALMEKMLGKGLHADFHITDVGEHECCITTNFDETVEITYNESLPRAIIEACVAAVRADKEGE